MTSFDSYNFSQIVLIVSVAALFFVLLTMTKLKRALKDKEEEIQVSFQKGLIKGRELVSLEIGQELHDTSGAMISVVKMYFDSIGKNTDKLDAGEKEMLNKANILIDQLGDEIRRISHDLILDTRHVDLKNKLVQLQRDINSTNGINIQLENLLVLEEVLLPNKHYMHLFMIIKELINNAIQHSKGRELIISFSLKKNELVLNYVDDGIGFDFENSKFSGVGLNNIKKRLTDMNGVWEFLGKRRKGTEFQINIPLKR